MSKRNHGDWITAYLAWTSMSEAPEAFHLWTAVSTIAGALQRRVYIDMRSFDWVPNFYIILVGKAGLVTKSTCLRMGESLLRKANKKLRFGAVSGSWQAMAKQIEAAASQPITGGLATSPISFFVSELGTFLEPNNREQLDFFVDSWDAQRVAFTRVTNSQGSLTIPCPCINILAGTTPTWIKENFSTAMIGGGFASRLIFVQGDRKRRLIAYPSLEAESADFERKKDQLVQDLTAISNLEGPMRLTPEALEWGKKWYEDHYTAKRQLSGERFDGFYARKQTHLHKLAMVLSVSQSDSLIVELRHLQAANELILRVERDLGNVIDNISSKQISALHKNEILSIVRDGAVDKEELYSHLYQLMGGVDYDRAINDLVKARQLMVTAKQGKTLLSLTHQPRIVEVPYKVVKEA